MTGWFFGLHSNLDKTSVVKIYLMKIYIAAREIMIQFV